MPFTLTSNVGGSGGGASFSIGTAQNVGDLMVVGVYNFNSAVLTITAATDTFGTTYSHSTFGGNGNTYAIIWGLLAGTGANTMTVTWSSGSSNAACYAEFTGTSVSGATQDGAVVGIAGNSTGTTTPAITTTAADDLIVNYILASSGGNAFGGSWSTATVAGGALGYQADVTAGTYTPSATFASGAFGSLCIALTAGGGGPSLATLQTLSSPRLV